MKDSLFGYIGIDTQYERSLIHYEPIKEVLRELTYKEKIRVPSPFIQRSRDFKISEIIDKYRLLIRRVEIVMRDIKELNKEEVSYIEPLIKEASYSEILAYEKKLESIEHLNYTDRYVYAYGIKHLLQDRLNKIEEDYAKQIFKLNDAESLLEAEERSLLEWEMLEQYISSSYERYNYYPNYDSDEPLEHGDIDEPSELSLDAIEELNELKIEKELLHTTLADSGYLHMNSINMLVKAVDELENLVYKANELVKPMNSKLENTFETVKQREYALLYLKIAYEERREIYDKDKMKVFSMYDRSENFLSDKMHYYQQLSRHSQVEVERFLLSLMQTESGDADVIGALVSQSFRNVNNSYKSTLSDTLGLFKEEATTIITSLGKLRDKEIAKMAYIRTKEVLKK